MHSSEKDLTRSHQWLISTIWTCNSWKLSNPWSKRSFSKFLMKFCYQLVSRLLVGCKATLLTFSMSKLNFVDGRNGTLSFLDDFFFFNFPLMLGFGGWPFHFCLFVERECWRSFLPRSDSRILLWYPGRPKKFGTNNVILIFFIHTHRKFSHA